MPAGANLVNSWVDLTSIGAWPYSPISAILSRILLKSIARIGSSALITSSAIRARTQSKLDTCDCERPVRLVSGPPSLTRRNALSDLVVSRSRRALVDDDSGSVRQLNRRFSL